MRLDVGMHSSDKVLPYICLCCGRNCLRVEVQQLRQSVTWNPPNVFHEALRRRGKLRIPRQRTCLVSAYGHFVKSFEQEIVVEEISADGYIVGDASTDM